MPMSRRDLLQRGLLAVPGVALGAPDAFIPDPPSPPHVPFSRPLVVSPVLTPIVTPTADEYDITMQEAVAGILPNRPTPVWTYNGLFPGPTIRARIGRTVVVRLRNNLFEPMSMHLHGGHVAASSAGHPEDLVSPGALKTYTFGNTQLPATLFVRDHAVGASGPHVYRGLAAFYIQGDAFEDALNLPTGAFDVPIMFQDRLFNPDGSFWYPATEDGAIRGVLGDRILSNGVIQPFFQVFRRKYRFRFLNASNARIYDLRLSNGQPLIQLGTDGGLLPAPALRSMIRLAPGERADAVVDFAGIPTGTQVFLRNTNRVFATSYDAAPRDLLRFDVNVTQADPFVVPATLRPFTPLGAEVRTRTFTITQALQAGEPIWLINGLPYDPARIDASPRLGEIEIWQIVNNSAEAQPLHLHLVQFQILDIAGVPPAPGDAGWKDTVNVPPGQTARVKTRFSGFTGVYAFGGTTLERADRGLMGQFQVLP
jgi:spore coat protein A